MPGTKTKYLIGPNVKTYNEVDEVCRQHDIGYANCEIMKDKDARAKCFRKEDLKMLQALERYKDKEGYTISKNAISAKIKLEDLFPWISSKINAYHGKAGQIKIKKKNIFATKPKASYTKDTDKAIEMISIDKEEAIPFGSFIYRMQPYPSDLDILEPVETNEYTNLYAGAYLAKMFQKLVKRLNKKKGIYIGDIKAGLHPVFFEEIYNNWNEIRNLTKSKKDKNKLLAKFFTERLENAYSRGYMTKEQLKEILPKVRAFGESKKSDRKISSNEFHNKFVQETDVIEDLYKAIREYFIIRWTPEEVIRGYKNIRSEKKPHMYTLEQACQDETLTKIDTWMKIDGKYVEVTNVFVLYNTYPDTEKRQALNASKDDLDMEWGLKNEIGKFYSSKTEVKPFKMAKRMYALARLKKYKNEALKLVYLLRSDIGILGNVESDLKMFISMLETIKNPPLKDIKGQLDLVKTKLNIVINVDFDADMLYKKINELVNKDHTKEYMIKELKEMAKYLNKIVSEQTLKYLKKEKLYPPPNKFLIDDANAKDYKDFVLWEIKE